jgi:hypothetical protein
MGGPHCTPPNSYRRGAFALVAVLAVAFPLALYAAQFEKRQLGVRPGTTQHHSKRRKRREQKFIFLMVFFFFSIRFDSFLRAILRSCTGP